MITGTYWQKKESKAATATAAAAAAAAGKKEQQRRSGWITPLESTNGAARRDAVYLGNSCR